MLPSVKTRNFLPSFVDEFFGNDLLTNFFDTQTGVNLPSVNVIEGPEDFKIEVAAPGLEKKDFKIDLHNNVLTVSSEKEKKEEVKDEKFLRREFSYTSFKRSFSMPDSVDAEKIKATHDNGILTISIPKKEHAKERPPREIKIT